MGTAVIGALRGIPVESVNRDDEICQVQLNCLSHVTLPGLAPHFSAAQGTVSNRSEMHKSG